MLDWGGEYEQHAAGPHSRAACIGQRAAPTAAAAPPAWFGSDLGDRLCPTLCGGIPGLCCLSLRLRIMDGEKALALRRPDLRSALPAGDRQHLAVRWPRCEREDVPGLAAVRL